MDDNLEADDVDDDVEADDVEAGDVEAGNIEADDDDMDADEDDDTGGRVGEGVVVAGVGGQEAARGGIMVAGVLCIDLLCRLRLSKYPLL